MSALRVPIGTPVSAVLVCLVCVIVTPPFPCLRPRTALCLHRSPSSLSPSPSFLQWLLPLLSSLLPHPLPISVLPPPRPRLVSLHWTRLVDGFSLRNLCVIAPHPPEPSAVQAPSPNLSGRRYRRGVWWQRGEISDVACLPLPVSPPNLPFKQWRELELSHPPHLLNPLPTWSALALQMSFGGGAAGGKKGGGRWGEVG